MRIIEFVTDNGGQAGWWSVVDQFNAWVQDPALSVEILEMTLTRRETVGKGHDQHALMVLYRVISSNVRISYEAEAQTDLQASFPDWFAAATDARAPQWVPVLVRGADMVSIRDSDAGKQYFVLYIDQTANPFNLGAGDSVFVGYPQANIAPLTVGTMLLVASDGTVVGNHPVTNVHPSNSLIAGVPSFVMMDQNDIPGADLMTIPLCNCV